MEERYMVERIGLDEEEKWAIDILTYSLKDDKLNSKYCSLASIP